MIAELRADGIPVLLVEQNVMRALEVCDRFFAFERGAVIFQGRPELEADRRRLIEVIAV